MRKGRINIVDILVIAMIIFMVFAIRYRFRNYHRMSDDSATTSSIRYQMRFFNVRDFTVDAFAVGDKVYDSLTNVEIGTIVDKSSKPAPALVGIEDGTLVESTLPGRYELLLTIETDGIINENGYYANHSVELKVGSEKIVESLYAKSSGRISSLQEIKTGKIGK